MGSIYSGIPFKISLWSSGVEHRNEENFKWRTFNSEIIDLGSVKLA
jgi:hypothetical protein